MTQTMIEVSNLSKRYGDFVAVDQMSFTVQTGEIFGLLGPNGAGKTTTLECLEGLRRPDNGTAKIAGIDPTKEAHKLRQVIGVQLQAAGMPEAMTPNEAMKFFCAYHGVSPRFDLLDRFGLVAKRDTQFHELSTGQQRRLALALAIAHSPQVLFLDEPTAGLDVASRTELHRVMRELEENGTTIILATHDMAEAEQLSDRVAILLHGRLVTIGTPLEITATGAGLTKVSVHTKANLLLQNGHTFPAVSQQQHREPYAIYMSHDIAQTVPALIAYIQDHADELLDLRVERPSLEERFLELTNDHH
ncbi:MAG: ABC transporter ATP-binding protein [Anaerolineales bacterium]|nr:ABC transporter ATP-binding protein [Anaerolineales bacterium]